MWHKKADIFITTCYKLSCIEPPSPPPPTMLPWTSAIEMPPVQPTEIKVEWGKGVKGRDYVMRD